MTYTFIAYKPDSSTYDGDYSYSSDFVCHNRFTREELVGAWASYLRKNAELNKAEIGYRFTILCDVSGIGTVRLVDEDTIYVDDMDGLSTRDSLSNEICKIKIEVDNIVKKFLDKKKAEAERLKAEQLEKEAKMTKKERLRQYEELRKEFGESK